VLHEVPCHWLKTNGMKCKGGGSDDFLHRESTRWFLHS
jgi:hypothetical protein